MGGKGKGDFREVGLGRKWFGLLGLGGVSGNLDGV
jgi:hypothetical protein